jgi:hypothetical protein
MLASVEENRNPVSAIRPRLLASYAGAKQNPRRTAGGYGKTRWPDDPAFPPRQDTLRFSADVLPRLVTSSYSTV